MIRCIKRYCTKHWLLVNKQKRSWRGGPFHVASRAQRCLTWWFSMESPPGDIYLPVIRLLVADTMRLHDTDISRLLLQGIASIGHSRLANSLTHDYILICSSSAPACDNIITFCCCIAIFAIWRSGREIKCTRHWPTICFAAAHTSCCH